MHEEGHLWCKKVQVGNVLHLVHNFGYADGNDVMAVVEDGLVDDLVLQSAEASSERLHRKGILLWLRCRRRTEGTEKSHLEPCFLAGFPEFARKMNL